MKEMAHGEITHLLYLLTSTATAGVASVMAGAAGAAGVASVMEALGAMADGILPVYIIHGDSTAGVGVDLAMATDMDMDSVATMEVFTAHLFITEIVLEVISTIEALHTIGVEEVITIMV